MRGWIRCTICSARFRATTPKSSGPHSVAPSRELIPIFNPGDPDAGFKFRQIVRANEILADPDQRATYDHLLDLAEKEKKQQANAKTMHKAATSVIALGDRRRRELRRLSGLPGPSAVSDRLKHFAETATASPPISPV